MEKKFDAAPWTKIAVLGARLILTAVFLMAFLSKVMAFNMIAEAIQAAGFPQSHLLAVLAALFEFGLVLALVTGAYFSEMTLAGAVYVGFLAFAFHGPSHWTDPKGLELGAFVSHFPFAAALMLAAAHGPGPLLVMKRGYLAR